MHTLFECREPTKAAKAAKVMTSMGNQGRATEGARLTNEWIQAGIIGEVSEVHVWSDRAGKLWKQGISAVRSTRTACAWPSIDMGRRESESHKQSRCESVHPHHPHAGYIGLQDHGSDAWYRNIKLLQLK